MARERGAAAVVVEDPAAALAEAREEAGRRGGTVVVAGSLYLLADLRQQVQAGRGGPPARLAPARKGARPSERI